MENYQQARELQGHKEAFAMADATFKEQAAKIMAADGAEREEMILDFLIRFDMGLNQMARRLAQGNPSKELLGF
jgi:hypothetical protein